MGILPDISINNRVVHHDAHRPQRPLEVRKSQSLPPPRRNGYLVTSEYPEHGREPRQYHNDAGRTRMEDPSHSRQLSLPSRHPRVESRRDQARSAPSHQVAPAHRGSAGVPAPRVNNLVSGPSLQGGRPTQFISKGVAGVPTRYQDQSHSKSHKFASSWAQVRAENHIEVTASDEKESNHVKETPRDNTKDPQRKTEKSISPFHARPREEVEKNKLSEQHPSRSYHARSLDNKAAQPHPGTPFHARLHEKENVQPDESQSHQPQSSQSKNVKEQHESTLVTSNLNSDPGAERHGDAFKDDQGDGKTTDAGDKGRKPVRRKPAWDDRLTLNPDAIQSPRGSWRKYEAELTYKPATTSTQHIYKAYVSRPKNAKAGDTTATATTAVDEDERDTRGDDNTTIVRQGAVAPTEEPASEASSRDKEYILSRNEARMYLQMQDAYESDSLRAARKKRFFKALMDVQLVEQRRQAEEEQRRRKRREESRRRQQRQLLHVRRKFRKEQAYRFRTQYVTLRALEQERRGDRQTYGLPDDSDDETLDDILLDSEDRKGGRRQEAGSTQAEPNSSAKTTSGNPGQRQIETTMSGKKSGPTNNDFVGRDASPHQKVTFSPENAADVKKNELNHSKTLGASAIGQSAQSSVVDTSFAVSPGKSPDKPTPQAGDNGRKDTTGKVFKNDPSSLLTNIEPPPQTSKATENRETELPAKRGNPGKGRPTRETNERQGKDRNVGQESRTKTNSENNEQLNRVDSEEPNSQSGKVFSAETANPSSKLSKDDSSSKKTVEKDPSGNSNIQEVEDRVIKDRATETPSKRETNHQDLKTVVPLADSTLRKNSKIQGKALREKGFEPPAVSQDNMPSPSLQTKAKGEKQEALAKVLAKASNKDAAQNRVEDSVVTNHPLNSTPSSKEATVKPEVRQKENIPVVKDSTATKTTIAKGKDGKFVATRTVNLQSGGALKNSGKVDDRIQISTSDVAVKEKQKRKPSLTHARSDAEKKRNFEKRYRHMFDVTGPSQKNRLKTPKMEGIDTVVIRETDKDGHTRAKKKDPKVVVKEAKQLINATSESESFDESATPRGQKPATTSTSLSRSQRPASTDTLDFDDDDDDDGFNDIFERVRQKYNLQIDSDDEDAKG